MIACNDTLAEKAGRVRIFDAETGETLLEKDFTAKANTSTVIGDLPQICAAMNRTNINVQLMTIEAAVTKKKDAIYQAAMMDPHTSSELSIDDIVALCDDLIEAHKGWLPEYK